MYPLLKLIQQYGLQNSGKALPSYFLLFHSKITCSCGWILIQEGSNLTEPVNLPAAWN